MQKETKKLIFLSTFIPKTVYYEKGMEKSFELNVEDKGGYFILSYQTLTSNHFGKGGKRTYVAVVPKQINRNQETFEVLGLLQAEIGKKQDGKIVFCNHEYKLVNKVLRWFEKEFDFLKNEWKWYIKVNINEPSNLGFC